jgi:hypothetical protein
LALVRFLTNSHVPLALVERHLDALLQDVTEYRLDEWEPSLTSQCLALAFQYWSSKEGAVEQTRAQEVMGKLALISPTRAFSLDKMKA